MNVLSLFDGMSCGQIALDRLGIKVDNYYASEIKKAAIEVTQYNYPKTIQVGDVTKLKTESLPKIDLLIAGSPCQDFSRANSIREGLQGKKSVLFYEFLRILTETQPKYWLLENVVMDHISYGELSKELGVYPVKICSSLVSGQLRQRLYWTNIKTKEDLFGFKHVYIKQPTDKNIYLQSLLDDGFTELKKSRCLNTKSWYPSKNQDYLLNRYRTTGMITLVFENQDFTGKVRTLNQNEMERLQTVASGYTKILNERQASHVLGDGWTIDVICHIFKEMKGYQNKSNGGVDVGEFSDTQL